MGAEPLCQEIVLKLGGNTRKIFYMLAKDFCLFFSYRGRKVLQTFRVWHYQPKSLQFGTMMIISRI
jgi:hypothetical protein